MSSGLRYMFGRTDAHNMKKGDSFYNCARICGEISGHPLRRKKLRTQNHDEKSNLGSRGICGLHRGSGTSRPLRAISGNLLWKRERIFQRIRCEPKLRHQPGLYSRNDLYRLCGETAPVHRADLCDANGAHAVNLRSILFHRLWIQQLLFFCAKLVKRPVFPELNFGAMHAPRMASLSFSGAHAVYFQQKRPLCSPLTWERTIR